MDTLANTTALLNRLAQFRASNVSLSSRKLSKSVIKRRIDLPDSTFVDAICQLKKALLKVNQSSDTQTISLSYLNDIIEIRPFEITDIHWIGSKAKMGIVYFIPSISISKK